MAHRLFWMAGPSDWCVRVGNDYVTTSPLVWDWFTVPAGFRFQVSIPRFCGWALNPHDARYLKAAALHDYAVHEKQWPRVRAAVPFSEALRAENLGRMHRLAMVLAVIIWKFR